MKPSSRSSNRGSVTLVAACFTAALAIALATYVAVASRAMNLSNRTLQTELSHQLTEMGLEQALAALNTNDWSSWTLDTTNRRATRTITFASNKFGTSGVTGSISLRIDNYDAGYRSNTWTSGTAYRINDLVGYSGLWYRCVVGHTATAGNAPNGISNLAYWVPEGLGWQWSSTCYYRAEDMVNYNGTWYRCILAHTASSSILPTNTTYWTSIPYLTKEPTFYNIHNAIVYWYGTWYRWDTPSSSWESAPAGPAIFWRWRSGGPTGSGYVYNDVVVYNNVWYRCMTPTTTGVPGSSTSWVDINTMWPWSSSVTYNVGDVVYSGGQRYRCIRAHSNQAPPNTTYWLNGPHLPVAWDPGRRYVANDTVFRNGIWYLCIAANNGQDPATSTNWVSTSNTSYQWNSTTAYSVGNHRSYGGVWYRCVAAHTNQSPNNSVYWSAVGATVILARGTATLVDGPSIQTQYRGVVQRSAQFPNAASATTTLTITGAGTVDSYDGSVSAITTAGTTSTYTYNQTTSPFSVASPNVGFSAVLAAGETSTTAISIGTTTIKGYLAAPSASTSPYAPQFSVGSTASLRNADDTVTSPHSTATNVDLTRISRSPTIRTFDPLPSTSIQSSFSANNFSKGVEFNEADATVDPGTGLATITLGTPGATTPSIYYFDDADPLYVGLVSDGYTVEAINIVGPVILYLNGRLYIRSGGRVVIHETGSLEVHCQRLRAYSGSHGIWNRTQDPKKLIVIADSTPTNAIYLDNGTSTVNKDFYGVYYAPYTTASLGLEIDSGVTVYGALSAREITFTSEANLRYDTSLRHHTFGGIDTPYTITDWRELTAANEKASF